MKTIDVALVFHAKSIKISVDELELEMDEVELVNYNKLVFIIDEKTYTYIKEVE